LYTGRFQVAETDLNHNDGKRDIRSGEVDDTRRGEEHGGDSGDGMGKIMALELKQRAIATMKSSAKREFRPLRNSLFP
jgi:hypothetical protein